VERLGRVPPIPETTNYVRKIRAIYKEAPVRAAAPAKTEPAKLESPKPEASKPEAPKPEAPKIYRLVDERGVVHFSNIEPPH
jgi:hypothetical protein